LRAIFLALLASICFLLLAGSAYAATPSASITVTPNSGPVGAKFTVSGQGFAPNANMMLEWSSGNASYVISQNPPQVTGSKVVALEDRLASVQADASGSFSVSATAPTDYSGQHFIQAMSANGTALSGQGIFKLEPSFRVSPTSGPAGTPITVTATGLGDGLYSTNFHLLWDNDYVGYMTGISTHGLASFTFYASGTPGTHYIQIYQGYPGPVYLNAEQIPSPSNLESYYPPLIPFETQFTVTSPTSSQGVSGSDLLALGSLGMVLAAFALTPVLAFRKPSSMRRGASRGLAVVLVVAALVVAGVAVYLAYTPTASTVTQASSSGAQMNYVPQVSVVRPNIAIPHTTAASGPRISVSPYIATVGTNVTVTGAGFAPNAKLPLVWTTRQGSNIQGYNLVSLPLRNVTAGADGTFSFNMKVPVDLGGVHYIAASNLTKNSNATLYIERSASISASQGPAGSKIVVTLMGVGWDYNTNIVALDYDNSFIGYACGFSSQGNVTVTLTAMGAPGYHTIDIYPSVWLGPENTIAIFRYPLLTPQDHPESMPSFHFSYLVTQSSPQQQGMASGASNPVLVSMASLVLGGLFLVSQAVRKTRSDSSPRWA
jgi:hypothetical protein